MLVMKHAEAGETRTGTRVAQTYKHRLHRVILTEKKNSSSYMETSEMRRVSKYLYSTDL